jgi:hypothetical protein
MVQHPSVLLSVFAFGTIKTELETGQDTTPNSNSIPIAVDLCAPASIFKEPSFFTSWTCVKNIHLSGIGGRIPIKGQRTAHFYILDDIGRKTSVRIKNAFYAPKSPLNLPCPQQWATQHHQKYGQAGNARFNVTAEHSKLSWAKGAQTKTIQYNSSNIPVLQTAAGFRN